MAITVKEFCEGLGVDSSLRRTLRAVDCHNTEHVWVVVGGERLYYNNYDKLDAVRPDEVITRIGVGGIAWDGTDWEWGDEFEASPDTWEKDLENTRGEFHAALKEHDALAWEEAEG